MGSDLFIRFIGLDLVSRAAERSGNSVDRLSNRINSASSRNISAAARQMAADNQLDKLRTNISQRTIASIQRQSSVETQLADLRSSIAQRTSSSYNERLRLEEAIAASSDKKANAQMRQEQRLISMATQSDNQRERIAMQEISRASAVASEEENSANRRDRAAMQSITQQIQNDKREEQLAGAKMDRLRNVSQSFIAGGIAATTFGASLLVVAGTLAAIAGASIHAANQFRSDMVMVVTHAGLAQNAINGVSNDLLKMAPAVGFGPDELAKAFYHVQSSTTSLGKEFQSISAKEDVLYQSAKLAAIGHADLTDTTNTVISVLSAYHDKIHSASDATAMLNAIVGNGNVTMQQFDSAMRGGLLPIAAQAGVNVASLGAAFGTLTDEGYGASQAATYLRSAIIQMSMPTGPATKALMAIGLAGEDVAKRMGFFNSVLSKAGINQSVVAQKLQETGSLSYVLNQVLMPALKKAGLNSQESTALIEKSFGGIRSGAGIVGLTANLQGLNDKERIIIGSTKEWADTWKYFQASDPDFAVKQLDSGFKSLEITIGKALTPAFLSLVNVLGPVIQNLIDFTNNHSQLVAVMLISVIAITLVGGVLLMMAGAALIVGGAFGVLATMIAAISGGALLAVLIPVAIALGLVAGALLLASGYSRQANDIFNIFSNTLQKTHNWSYALYLSMLSLGIPISTASHLIADFHDGLQKTAAVLGLVVEPIRQAFQRIKASIPQEDLNNLTLATAQLADAFQRFLLPVLGILALLLGSLLGGVFNAFVEAMVVFIPAAVRVMANYFVYAANVIKFFGDFFTGVVKVITDLVHGDFAAAWRDADQMISDMQVNALAILTSMLTLVGSIFDMIGSTVLHAVWGLVTGVIGAFQNLWDVLVGHSIIPDMARDIVRVFINLGPQVVGAVEGWVGSVIGRFAGMAGQAFSATVGVGQAVANGISAGLRGAWGGIVSTLHGLASSLPGPVRDALGITSPSRVFAAQVGLPIAQGIALGITRGAGGVNAALGSLVGVGAPTGLPAFGTSTPGAIGAKAGAAIGGNTGQNDTNSLLAAIHAVLVDINAEQEKQTKASPVTNRPRSGDSNGTSNVDLNQLANVLYTLVNKGAQNRNRGLRSEFAL